MVDELEEDPDLFLSKPLQRTLKDERVLVSYARLIVKLVLSVIRLYQSTGII